MKTAYLLATFAIVIAASAARAEPLPNPFFAMDTICNRGSEPLDAKLDDLRSMGYAGLAWTGTNLAQLQAVISGCEARGLKLYTTYVGFPLLKDHVQVPDNIEAVFAALSKHGTIVWVYMQSNDFKNSDPAGDAVAVPDLQKLADRAAQHNIKLALYPHAGFWAQSYPDCLRIAKAVRRPNLGVSFNLCHVLKTGDEQNVLILIKESQPHLFVVTLNGADAGVGPRAGWDRLIQPIGQGTHDLAPLLKTLREIGYIGSIGFQGYGIQGERKEIMRATMEGWKKINAGL